MVEPTVSKVTEANAKLKTASESMENSISQREAGLAAIGNSLLLLEEMQGLLTLVHEKREANNAAAQRLQGHVSNATQQLEEAQIDHLGPVAKSLVANTSASIAHAELVQRFTGVDEGQKVSELYSPDKFTQMVEALGRVQTRIQTCLEKLPETKQHVDTAIGTGTVWLSGLGQNG